MFGVLCTVDVWCTLYSRCLVYSVQYMFGVLCTVDVWCTLYSRCLVYSVQYMFGVLCTVHVWCTTYSKCLVYSVQYMFDVLRTVNVWCTLLTVMVWFVLFCCLEQSSSGEFVYLPPPRCRLEETASLNTGPAASTAKYTSSTSSCNHSKRY